MADAERFGASVPFGPYLRSLREHAQLTQRVLAERAGVDESYISKLERGRTEHTPSVRTLQDMATALGVDPLVLMDHAAKVPMPLARIAQDQAAMRFFRRALERQTTSAEWDSLTAYLERTRDPADSRVPAPAGRRPTRLQNP
jgi:transcriptional regulator with XRE-family HTH domain